ncbi:ABC transporter permease [Salipiger bermudensis]|uniref:ABC transporter permease n=1 Tax=Salipiger bermudensis TaxID=344736 RepID=UPI001CD80B3E|nr:ABC transporter permease [Salipiger bermudensis]MCA1287712.1 ABC transporter permease [Salipiger bermudensis]
MIEIVLRRILISALVLVAVTVFCFLLLQLVPGDPAQVIAGPIAPPDVVASVRESLGLDRPLPYQFWAYASRLAAGDLGQSLISNRPVSTELAEAIGPTAELMFACLVWSIPAGTALGTLAAARQGSVIDRTIMALSVAGLSLPVFFICLLLTQLIGVTWQLLPFVGREGPLWTVEGLRHIALPALSLGLIFIGPVARISRSSVLEVMRLDHVRTARAKGLSQRRVLIKHVLRNALIPIVTLVGLQAGYLMGGAVVTESIFSWPGIGRLAVGSIVSSDFALAQGAIMVMAVSFMVINLLVDVLYALLDPRIQK